MLRFNYFTLKKSLIIFSYINIFRVFLLLLPICDSLSVVDRVHVPSQLQQHVHKRQGFDDYRVCASNFEIHQDKIIRTEESKRLGAKYLNGKDVTSKDECVKFCCDTLNCNVFVLEEKVFNQQIGTCYLFDCGPPESFKCKFTRHLNYSSAVLIINRPQIQLEDEIQYSQHEHELTSLRKHGRTNTASDDVMPVMRDTKDMGKSVSDDNGVEETTYKKSGKCSRYQFECRTSGECIAIYNACDGIPQCADKSDEDIELGCPTTPPIIPKKPERIRANHVVTAYKEAAASPPVANMVEQNFLMHQQQSMMQQQQQQQQQLQQFLPQQHYNQQMNGNLWPLKSNPQAYYDGPPIRNDPSSSINENYPVNTNAKTQISPAVNYGGGREGELVMAGPNPWSNKNEENHILKQNYGPLHNFNRKQNDATNIPLNEGEYNNVPANVPYDTYSNGYMVNNGYPLNADVWHQKYGHAVSNTNTKNTNISENKLLPEYAYEAINGSAVKNGDRGRTANLSSKSLEIGKVGLQIDKKISNANISIVIKNEKINNTTPAVSNKQFVVSSDSTAITTTGTTAARKEVEVTTKDESSGVTLYEDKQKSHRKLENYAVSSDLSVKTLLLDDVQIRDGLTEQPSGAFISLTLGICVTAIMVLVVGCRMKAVRKRIIRRGGKLPYAHDADFLVNGMYL